jgi:hypothetical protein
MEGIIKNIPTLKNKFEIIQEVEQGEKTSYSSIKLMCGFAQSSKKPLPHSVRWIDKRMSSDWIQRRFFSAKDYCQC